VSTPKQAVTLGPFVGGLNNAANTPDTIKDDELNKCIDFDYNIDYTLVTRPPVAVEALTGNGSVDGKFCKILGFYTDPTSGNVYCIANINNSLYYRANSTSYKDAGAWTLIQASFGNATCGIQYVDNFYIGKDTSGGAKWNSTTGYTAISVIPAVNSMAVFKERIWASSATTTNGSRLYFSDLATGDTWGAGANFIDIGAGDGQKLIKVFSGPSMLYMFKSNSTYVFTYDTKPSLGYVQNISTTVGINDVNCVTDYQGPIFVMHGNKVYKLDGTSFTRLNAKVVIDRDTTAGTYPQPYSLSTVGDRIAVQFKDNIFMYYPLTDTWTEWNLPAVGKWFYVPNSIQKYGYKIYLTSVNSTAPTGGNVLELQEKTWDNTLPADVNLGDPILLTKMYALDTPQVFKRLHWWGVDATVYQASTQNAYIRLVALPYVFSSYETWNLLRQNLTWNQVSNGTWADLASEVGAIPSRFLVTSSDRKYIKADKSLRFSRIQFKVQLDSYDHSAVSSINHIILEISSRQDPVSRSEGIRA
jgi:hypothetical protein